MSQKPSLFAAPLQLFAFGDPMAPPKSQKSKELDEQTGSEFDLDINSKLPADLRKALNLDAEDKAWKDVDKLDDLKEAVELKEGSYDAKSNKIGRRRKELANVKALRLGRMDIPPAKWKDWVSNPHAKDDPLKNKPKGGVEAAARNWKTDTERNPQGMKDFRATIRSRLSQYKKTGR